MREVALFRTTLCLLVAGLISFSGTGFAVSLRVPQDYPDITEASNAAQPGDSILVWPPPVGNRWVDQTITLQQGVTLRGMTNIWYDPWWVVGESFVYLLEAPPNGGDDTTRVENLRVSTAEQFHENFQVYTPRSSIMGCVIGNGGPYDTPCVRAWKGGIFARNGFSCGEGVTIREGTVRVEGNWFANTSRPINIYNLVGNPELADASIRSNTVYSGGGVNLQLRAGSQAEVVNNILVGTWLLCSEFADVDVRFNDIYNSPTVTCELGAGNIDVDPQFCPINSILRFGVEPDSPCVGSGEDGVTMGAGGICGVTGIEGEAPTLQRPHLTVEPNPVSTSAQFSFDQDIEAPILEIFDPQGRLVDLLRPLGPVIRWSPARSWPRGVYFARLRGQGVSETVKFLVIR
jgi:hypothetical protein